jgi:hypothetical protein
MKPNFREKNLLQILQAFVKSPVDLAAPIALFSLHIVYILLIVYLILFSLSTWHLFVVFCLLTVNITANMMLFRSCPLALMEDSFINTNCFRSITLLFFKTKKNSSQKKILSKRLRYRVPETTTQNLIWLYLLTVIKMLYLFTIEI